VERAAHDYSFFLGTKILRCVKEKGKKKTDILYDPFPSCNILYFIMSTFSHHMVHLPKERYDHCAQQLHWAAEKVLWESVVVPLP